MAGTLYCTPKHHKKHSPFKIIHSSLPKKKPWTYDYSSVSFYLTWRWGFTIPHLGLYLKSDQQLKLPVFLRILSRGPCFLIYPWTHDSGKTRLSLEVLLLLGSLNLCWLIPRIQTLCSFQMDCTLGLSMFCVGQNGLLQQNWTQYGITLIQWGLFMLEPCCRKVAESSK